MATEDALIFEDRRDAGRRLASALQEASLDTRAALILALPRGGVPVAFEVASALKRPLDVVLVRKIGVPGHEEFAMGAIASGGVQVINERLVQDLKLKPEAVAEVIQREQAELQRRENLYRRKRAPLHVTDRDVLLVDDGVATGSTVKAAIQLLREQGVKRIVVAVPTAPPDTVRDLASLADEVITVTQPRHFESVGKWYRNFTQTGDEEVRELLAASKPHPGP